MKRFIGFIALLLFDIGAAMELLGKDDDSAALRIREERAELCRRLEAAAAARRPGRIVRLIHNPIWHYSPSEILEAVRFHDHYKNQRPRVLPAVEYVFPDDSQPWRN